MYCCVKRMKLLGLETRSEVKCLSNELKSQFSGYCLLFSFKWDVELRDVSKDAKFWTSASSEKCPKEFGWCSSRELMDYDGLSFPRDKMDASKFCMTASMSAPVLSLKEDDCANNNARAICEV